MELRFEGYNILNHPNFANPYLPNFIADAGQQGIASGMDLPGRSALASLQVAVAARCT